MGISSRGLVLQEQSPAFHQRVSAAASIDFSYRDGRTRLSSLYQQGSAKVRFPRNYQDQLEAVFINTAGGLTGGDQLNWKVRLHPNASVAITTQACEKAYKASSGVANVTTNMQLDASSTLHWLPQETILFDESALSRRFDVELDKTATLLALESVQLGRGAMGEVIDSLSFHDRWRIKREGRLEFADDLRLIGEETSSAKLGGNTAFASLAFIAPQDEEFLNALASRLRARCPALYSGFSVTRGRLTGRILAQDSYLLRQAVIPVLDEIRGCDLPRVWRA